MTKICKIILKDEVWCNLVGLSPSEIQLLWNKFGILVEGAYHIPAVRLGRWDGKIRFFEKTGKTYIRLLPEVIPYLIEFGYDVDIDDQRSAQRKFPKKRATHDQFKHIIAYGGLPAELRPYQVEIVNTLIESRDGIALAATGAGKTSMCASICDIFRRR